MQKSGTEAHSSLGVGERYHDSLSKTFLELREDHPNLKEYVLFAVSTKAFNETLGPESIVPSALAF